MQDAADATALAMAKQLGVATAAGISARAQDYATGQLASVVSELSINAQGQATVVWSDTLNGTARTVGSTVTVPTNLAIANLFEHLQPVHIGQHKVENNQVVIGGVDVFQSDPASGCGVDGVSGALQTAAEKIGDALFVLDDQNSH